jgi:hypothetical protein
LNLKKQPHLCDVTAIGENENNPADNANIAVYMHIPGIIRITVPFSGEYTVSVYTVQGRQLLAIDKSFKESGIYTVICDGILFAPGLYVIKITGMNIEFCRKITVLP